MSDQKVSIDGLADAIMDGLTEYAGLASDEMKKAVKKSAGEVKDQISENAPKRTGKYASSWRTKNTKESSNSLEVTVYSPTRYQLAHLLEHGHAKRGGGRSRAFSHIAPAAEAGEEKLEQEIKRALESI